jgi:cadmium resistance protein CadD (predicted permease)
MAGVVFLIIEFYGFDFHKYSRYVLPFFLILMGIYVILKKRKH